MINSTPFSDALDELHELQEIFPEKVEEIVMGPDLWSIEEVDDKNHSGEICLTIGPSKYLRASIGAMRLMVRDTEYG